LHLFSNIDDETIQKQLEKLHAMKTPDTAAEPSAIKPSKPEITFEDFAKTDIRIGTILEAEKVPKADKLLKLLVDTGIDKRTVVSGIAEFYKPENIIGQKVCILVNLAPRKLRGIESQGMILMAEDANGKLCFVQPSENAGNGSDVK